MAENTAPFRNITRKDHPLKISPVSIGAVRSSMIPPAYRPRRAEKKRKIDNLHVLTNTTDTSE